MAQSFEPVLKDRSTTGEPFHLTLSKLPGPKRTHFSMCRLREHLRLRRIYTAGHRDWLRRKTDKTLSKIPRQTRGGVFTTVSLHFCSNFDEFKQVSKPSLMKGVRGNPFPAVVRFYPFRFLPLDQHLFEPCGLPRVCSPFPHFCRDRPAPQSCDSLNGQPYGRFRIRFASVPLKGRCMSDGC